MSQRFPINAGGGPVPGLIIGLAGAPAIGGYLRFIQHEAWGLALAFAGAALVLGIAVAVWGSRMNGRAIELTDEGIAFPRWWTSTPELVVWTGVEACTSSFVTTTAGPDHYFDVIYFGGRRRRIYRNSVTGADELEREIGKRIPAPS